MIDRDGLPRLFRRVLITATYTKPFQDWSEVVRLAIGRMSGRPDLDRMGVVCYLESEDQWLLVALNELIWRQQGGPVCHLAIDELSAAKIDLLVNRSHGFVPSKGFGTITLVAVDGAEHHVSMEPGSAAEAMLRVVTELIRRSQSLG